MNLKYSLDKDDYLQYQLYISSTTKSIKNKRLHNWVIVTFIFVILSILFYQTDNKFLMYSFFVFAIITLIFYPLYQRSQYKRHYEKFIDETYKNRFDKESNVIFKDVNLETFDLTGESKINYSSLEKIIEISSHFFLKIKTGGSLIIPKSKVEDIEKVRTELRALSEKIKIDYSAELNWKWKIKINYFQYCIKLKLITLAKALADSLFGFYLQNELLKTTQTILCKALVSNKEFSFPLV